MFKFVVLSVFLAVASAGYLGVPAASFGHSVAYAAPAVHAAPLTYAYHAPAPVVTKVVAPVVTKVVPVVKTVEPEAPAHYDFEYAVNDATTGDIKSQKESRNGDVVTGMYSLIEPDGAKRTVEYSSDAVNGFNAVVHREPAAHPVVVKQVAPTILKTVSPIVKYHAPIVKYHAPIVSAPIVKYHAPYGTYLH